MDPTTDLTRRQQIWLLDRQMEAIDRAVHDAIATTPQPKPSDSQARRIVEEKAGIRPFSLAAVRVATRIMSSETADAIERAMGYSRGSIHPLDAVPPHDELPHPDLGGLRLWEGEQPIDEGTVPVSDVSETLTAAFSLPGRDRLLLSRASGIDQTALSRMTRGSCKGVTRANLRVLAHVLGLSPRVLGLEGPANVDPPTWRPDIRYMGHEGHVAGPVTTAAQSGASAFGSYVVPVSRTDEDEPVLELTEGMRQKPDGEHDVEEMIVGEADAPPSHARIIDPSEASGRLTGISYVVDPVERSALTVLGRMTGRRFLAIANALDLPIEGTLGSDDDAVAVDIRFIGDDDVAARGYAALTAPRPVARKPWFLRS